MRTKPLHVIVGTPPTDIPWGISQALPPDPLNMFEASPTQVRVKERNVTWFQYNEECSRRIWELAGCYRAAEVLEIVD